VLIPKTHCPQKNYEYRPISLVHGFAKIIKKELANRLGPELDHIISYNQTAFIRKRCIHESFLYVQQVIRALHKKKTPVLFIKLDISKAFDNVNWPYLLKIMSHLGFGQKWKDWIPVLWCTSSSSVLLNGEPGKRILHCKGVRQGGPLSPMLFLLAIELLHMLFKRAQELGLLSKLSANYDNFRVSLYADDAAVFLAPNKKDLEVTNCILDLFSQASGLKINAAKTCYYSIQCADSMLQLLSSSEKAISTFPCTILGLPLDVRNHLEHLCNL
jgi:hypothetical protein